MPVEEKIAGEMEGMPPTEIKCRFKAPARCGDLLEVHTSIAKKFNKGLMFRFDLYRKEDDKLLATGSMTHVSINEKRKAITLPHNITEAINRFEECD